MIVSIVDTTVLIHLFRNNPVAVAWAGSQTQQLAITSITWLEFMVGARNKVAQTSCKVILNQFDLWHLTVADQDWAMQQMEQYRLSRGVSINDCFIASTPHRLQVPFYTDNLRHMQSLVGPLAQKPY